MTHKGKRFTFRLPRSLFLTAGIILVMLQGCVIDGKLWTLEDERAFRSGASLNFGQAPAEPESLSVDLFTSGSYTTGTVNGQYITCITSGSRTICE